VAGRAERHEQDEIDLLLLVHLGDRRDRLLDQLRVQGDRSEHRHRRRCELGEQALVTQLHQPVPREDDVQVLQREPTDRRRVIELQLRHRYVERHHPERQVIDLLERALRGQVCPHCAEQPDPRTFEFACELCRPDRVERGELGVVRQPEPSHHLHIAERHHVLHIDESPGLSGGAVARRSWRIASRAWCALPTRFARSRSVTS
jgi:hypothetical protein